MNLPQHMLTTAILLTAFAVAGTGLVAFTYEQTKQPIEIAEREALLHTLHSVIDVDTYDNELIEDQVEFTSQHYLGSKNPLPVFRARKQGLPVAAIITTVAPDGYNGNIKLLIGIQYDGTITGVRTISHRETPGLGDAIEIRRSDWILGFNGHNLQSPGEKKWRVKKDGGYFDQFTGATITPRAIVKAVHKALEFFELNKDQIFQQPVAARQTNQNN